MYMVQSAWPNADLLGVDMSTFKLAISQTKLEKKPVSVKSKVGMWSFSVPLFWRRWEGGRASNLGHPPSAYFEVVLLGGVGCCHVSVVER